jgi:hypothetical protein
MTEFKINWHKAIEDAAIDYADEYCEMQCDSENDHQRAHREALLMLRETIKAALSKTPAWHDKPTAPGLWVVGSRCLHINELDLPIYERSNCRWFGPVPADDGGKP